jgi:hypothetical protein
MLSFLAVTMHQPSFRCTCCWAVRFVTSLLNSRSRKRHLRCETGMEIDFSYWVSRFSKCEDVRESRTWGSRVVSYRAVPGSRHTRRGSDPKMRCASQCFWSKSCDSVWIFLFRLSFFSYELKQVQSIHSAILWLSRGGDHHHFDCLYMYI